MKLEENTWHGKIQNTNTWQAYGGTAVANPTHIYWEKMSPNWKKVHIVITDAAHLVQNLTPIVKCTWFTSRAKLTAADDIIATLLILYISLLAHQHRSCIQWILADWEESIFQINVLHLIICSGLAHVTKACVCVCVFICVCVSVCLSACVSVCLYVCVSVFLCFCVSVWQCVCVGRCWMWKQMITCCSASGVWRFSQIQMISAHASQHLICAACYIRNVSTTSFLKNISEFSFFDWC